MVKIAILGATGYTALELLKILARHPQAEVTVCTTRQEGNPPLHTIHPGLRGRFNVNCADLSPAEVGDRADFVFCCLPHVASMEAIPTLLQRGCQVVDLSADYRLNDPGVYERWYGHAHTDAERLASTVYGLPELYRDRIPGERLIANPGCYTSASILGLAPLLKHGVIDASQIVIDAKSGVSGAGRTPKLNTLFSECNEGVSPYSIGYAHRHAPEIEQVLSHVSGRTVEVLFSPHLIPMDRGIVATMYAPQIGSSTEKDLLALLRDFYQKEPFIRVVEQLPSTKDSAHTNYCDITVRVARGKVIVVSCLDNLIKGASGVAVQNFNLLCGFDETTALL